MKSRKAYSHWVRQFIFFHNIKNPRQMGAAEVEAFLTHPAVERRAAAPAQTQALFALLFLYRKVLRAELP